MQNNVNNNHCPASTFPETFKDFFTMINEDEDHVELVSNILEDKIIPRRHNIRNRCRTSSAKISNSSSLLPTVSLAARSNSFRINRIPSYLQSSNRYTDNTSDFCKHVKYCCLHQSAFTDKILPKSDLDQTSRNFGFCNPRSTSIDHFSTKEMSSNFSDDEKTIKFDREQQSLANVFHQNEDSTSVVSELKMNAPEETCVFLKKKTLQTKADDFGMNSRKTYLDPFSINRSHSNVENVDSKVENFDENTDQLILAKKEFRKKSPVLNRRRASLVNLARTIPNFGPALQSSDQKLSTNTKANQSYRYMTDDGLQQQYDNYCFEKRSQEKYTRCKSPHILTNKTVETSTPALSAAEQRQQRSRTASMPAENRRPRLAETRRAAIHCGDIDMEYYRLRSFSITSHGICNLGDSMRSRRSRSINSVTSSNSGRERNSSIGSQHFEEIRELQNEKEANQNVPYKIAMLGDAGVGKTALTYQFTTSEYICAYDLSLDDDYGQKTVSVLLNNQETDLEIIDHPSCEMSVEAFCSTYSIDLFVVVYSVVEKKTFKTAEKILLYLKENEIILTRGAILVGNKTDLERQREVSTPVGKKLAKEIGCKFIETSSGLDHNVDELLVGIVAQIKLNPQRLRNLTDKQRSMLLLRARCPTDHLSELRRNEKNKSNNKKLPASTRRMSAEKKSSNEDNIEEDLEDETDDEESSVDLEGQFNSNSQHTTNPSEFSRSMALNKLLKSRRYATSGLGSIPGPTNFFNKNLSNSNNDVSSSSCSTPTSVFPIESSKSIHTFVLPTEYHERGIKKRDSKSYDSPSTSKLATPKKSVQSGSDNSKCFSSRTKMFLTSFLKFKRSLRIKRRKSSSCSDLFVI